MDLKHLKYRVINDGVDMRLKQGIRNPLNSDNNFNKILESIKGKRHSVNIVNGASESGKSYIIYGIYEKWISSS